MRHGPRGTPDKDANFYPTPITRIGGGEVRVTPAVVASSFGGDPSNGDGNLSLGLADVTSTTRITKQVNFSNASGTARTFTFTPTFRDPADAALGAVRVDAPPITVAAGSSAVATLTFTIDGAALPTWAYSKVGQVGATAGARGNDGRTSTGPRSTATCRSRTVWGVASTSGGRRCPARRPR